MLTLAIAATLSVSLGWTADVQKKDVDIKAPDGTNLKGSYFSPGRSGPGMILLHQCNMDRHAWDGLAQDLANAGFHVLTVDFRSYGQSGGEKLSDPAQRRAAVQEKWPGDVDATYAFLTGQKGVDKSRLAAGGASCGVTQSSDLAARHHEIKALMLLSGQTTDAARAYITSSGLPVFGAASEGDTSAANGIREAVGASKNSHSTQKIYNGTEHGVPMFAKNPDLEPMIVMWLKTQVGAHEQNTN
jgi:dienelactone hydrolase